MARGLQLDHAREVGGGLRAGGALAAAVASAGIVGVVARERHILGAVGLGVAPVGAEKGQALKAQIVDITLLVGLALQHEQLQRARGAHVGVFERLTGQRQIGQAGAGAVEVPLTRLAQRVAHVVEVIVGQLRAERTHRRGGAGARHRRQARGGVVGGDGRALFDPKVDEHHLDLAQRDGRLGSQHVRSGARRRHELVIRLHAPARWPIDTGHALHAVESRFGQAGPRAALAVDVQLAKVPFAGAHVGQVGHPGALALVGGLLPAADRQRAIQDGGLAGVSAVGHGRRILRAE